MPLGFIAFGQAFACRGGDAAPNDARASVGAPVASLRRRYSGSEGEMLRKEISTVVAAARCGNPAVVCG